MSGFGQRLFALTRKEFRQLMRDRSSLLLGIGLPIFLILIFGYGMSLDIRNVPVAVVMEDSSPTAHDVISGLQLSRYFSPRIVSSRAVAVQQMQTHEVDAMVVIPNDFSSRLNKGEAQIQVILQGVDANRATMVRAYLTGAVHGWAQKRLDRGNPGTGSIVVLDRMWFNAANTSTWYLVPGLTVLIMTLIGAFLTALVMAREWERGTLESLFVTPAKPVEILLAKVIPYFVVGMLGMVLCLLAAKVLFAVPLYGSLWVLLAGAMLYQLVAVGMGLLISAVTKNQFVASQVALVTSFLPALLLSGFIFDLRNVPAVIRWIGNALPATYFMELVKTLFLAGNDWNLIIKNCIILAVYAMVLLGLARVVTRKTLD